jgi:methionyl-tRNA formyltransferase
MMGTPEFAVASLEAIHAAGISIRAVVTAPDKPAGRGKKMRASAMSIKAEELGIPTMKPTNLKNPEFLEALQQLGADLFVVVAFRMLPEQVWKMPPLGTINLHGSLLPDYRGAAPINRAIMNGETRTGATTFFIQQKIDTGDIIDRVELDIGPNETAGQLHDRMMLAGADLLVETVERIFSGVARRTPQIELNRNDYHDAPKIHTADRRIDWNLPAGEVHNHIRGLSPYPGAWTMLDGAPQKQFKILRSAVVDKSSKGIHGRIYVDDDRLLVDCASGRIEILRLQAEGKRAMDTVDFLRGTTMETDHQFN